MNWPVGTVFRTTIPLADATAIAAVDSAVLRVDGVDSVVTVTTATATAGRIDVSFPTAGRSVGEVLQAVVRATVDGVSGDWPTEPIVLDKSVDDLNQSFPANFSSLAIDLGGNVTYNNAQAASITPEDIWSHNERTLTSLGTPPEAFFANMPAISAEDVSVIVLNGIAISMNHKTLPKEPLDIDVLAGKPYSATLTRYTGAVPSTAKIQLQVGSKYGTDSNDRSVEIEADSVVASEPDASGYRTLVVTITPTQAQLDLLGPGGKARNVSHGQTVPLAVYYFVDGQRIADGDGTLVRPIVTSNQ